MQKLTKRLIDSTEVVPNKDFTLWDAEVKGFGIRVRGGGTKTFILQYRNAERKEKKIKIGLYGTLTVEQARDKARFLANEVALGKDPSQEKRLFLQQSKENTYRVADLVNEFFVRYAPVHLRVGTIKKNKTYCKLYIVPEWGNKKLSEITREDGETLKAKLKNTSATANQVIALMSRLLNLAVEWGKIENNPFLKIKKYKEHKRMRWAEGEEFSRLWEILNKYRGYVSANALIFALLTGSRKGEVYKATWEQFNLEQGVWIKPHQNTKQKKTEYIPLSQEALAFLLEMKETSQGPFLFPGRNKPDQPITDVKKFWAIVKKEANLTDLRIHDLRHTYASHLVSSGLSLSIVGKLLGHTQAATTQRYAHLADQALRDATNVFGNKIANLKKNGTSSQES